MRVHFVIHEAFEAPGAYETWAHQRGCTITWSRLHAGEPLPPSAEDIDLLAVMGGPQSPSTTKEECPHFDAAAERALIVQCVAAGKAVVGVCLGSQLIGEALGAAYAHSPEKEIGKFPITMTAAGRANPKFSHFPESLEVGHWHNDMPGLPEGAKVLATSAGCPRQIVEFGPLVYGFQCHMELTAEVVEQLIAASAQELAGLAGYRFVQQPAALRANSYAEMNEKLFGFLDNLMQTYAESRYIIRNVQLDDRAQWDALYAGYARFYRVDQTADMRDTVWRWLHDEHHETYGLVAENSSGQLIGLAHFRAFARPLSATTGCFLDDLFVAPDARGKKVADALIEHIRAQAREQGWSVVRWITADGNYRARAVYDRLAVRTNWLTYDAKP